MYTFTRFHKTMSRDDELNALNQNFAQVEKKSADDQKASKSADGVWSDYTPTITGWSSTTGKTTRYTVINDTVMVWIHVDGTSNATTATITLPHKAKNQVYQLVRTWDGSNENMGRAAIVANSSNLTVSRGSSTGSSFNNWATTGQKQISGLLFVYEKA